MGWLKVLLFAALCLIAGHALAAINLSIEGLAELVVYLIVVGGILWLLLWLIGYCGLPEPFSKVAKIIIMVVAVLICVNVLLGFVGHPVFTMR